MGSLYNHLTETDRLKLEALIRAGCRINYIADELGKHRSTIYRELKRGMYEHLNSDYTTTVKYDSNLAQMRYEKKLSEKGPGLKIGSDRKLANYIEKKICDEHYSPEATLAEIKTSGKRFSVVLSKPTIYSYIDKGIFLRLTNDYLPIKGKKKRTKTFKRQKRANAGTSIEKRDKSILTRTEFGHWEMDTVVGAKGVTQSALLVLTERKTREELIYKMPSREAHQVVDVIDQLELKWGKRFPDVFKTITVDNGSEFSRATELEGSIKNREVKRVKVYYCHAYASSERGSNENQNRMIRRWLPKGYDFDDVSHERIKEIERWINQYPRRMFGYRTSEEKFFEELNKLSA